MDSDLLNHAGNNIAIENTGVSLETSILSGRGVGYFPGTSINNYLIFDLGETPYTATVTFWVKGNKDKSTYFSSYRNSGNYNTIVTQAEFSSRGRGFSCCVFSQNYVASSHKPLDGVWHKITLTRGGGSYSLYLDKTLLGTATYSNTAEISKFNFGGSLWDTTGWLFKGYMAEAKVLSDKREQADVDNDYDAEKSIFGIS